jgi:hypothetical protein
VVLPTAHALRIVFIKNRVPVLSRLIPGITQASEQVTEIVRTLRHLENTHVLERSGRKHGVLMLGDTQDLAALLAAHQLQLLDPPSPWTNTAPADWRFVLFDLVLTSPAGQLASLSRRASFVAARVRQPAYALAAVSLGLALWASVGNLREIVASHSTRIQIEGRTEQLTEQLNEVEQKMAGFGVPPELVRQAAALDREELASAPSLAAHMQQLGQVIGQRPEMRVGQFDWRILQPGQAACARGAPTPAANPEVPVAEAAAPKRQVEISFDITLPQDQPARARAQSVASLSTLLAKLQGVTLIRDPAKTMLQATLSGGGARPEAEQALSWCLSLPGQPATRRTPGDHPTMKDQFHILSLARRCLTVLAAALLIALALYLGSSYFRERGLARLTQAQQTESANQAGLAGKQSDLANMQAEISRFNRLRQQGMVGTPDREGWVEQLLSSRQRTGLPDAGYTLEASRPLALQAGRQRHQPGIGRRGQRQSWPGISRSQHRHDRHS